MQRLSDLELLAVWQQGLTQPPLEWALSLLTAASAPTPVEQLAALSIGDRDARLLTLQEWLFGSHLNAVTTCPHCSEPLELAFEVADIRMQPTVPLEETLRVQHSGYQVTFRLPNSHDLMLIERQSTAAAAHQLLLERCLLTVEQEAAPTDDASATPASAASLTTDSVDLTRQLSSTAAGIFLPDAVVEAIAQHMAAADPQANLQLACVCPQCSNTWQETFDIVAFLWSEIHSWAKRTLRDVHILASAYGWAEADILNMGTLRRQLYLEMVNG